MRTVNGGEARLPRRVEKDDEWLVTLHVRLHLASKNGNGTECVSFMCMPCCKCCALMRAIHVQLFEV
jgi:hypothetical protein